MFKKPPNFQRKALVRESFFGKTVSPHVCNCIKKDAINSVFLRIDFVNIIFLVHFTQASVRVCSTKKVFLKIWENLQENTCARVFFLEKIAHHQACKFIKKRLQHRYFNVNFAKLLKTLCRTPPVSASNFLSTFLTFILCKTYIYVFPALLFLDISKPLKVPHRS